MKRQERYPETQTFRYYNANPKNRITGDCWCRAISTATGVPYNEVVMGMAKLHCETGYDAMENITRYMQRIGWVRMPQPRHKNGRKYTGEEFCNVQQEWLGDIDNHGNEWDDNIVISPAIVANIGGHHMVAIMDGKINDIWNSTGGCIGNYWIKW